MFNSLPAVTRRFTAVALVLSLLLGVSALPGVAAPAAAAEGGYTECADSSVEYGENILCTTYFTTDTWNPLVGHANTTAVNSGGEQATVTPAWCDTGWDNFLSSCTFTITADVAGPTLTIQSTWSGYYIAPFNPSSLTIDITRAPFDVGVADATRAFGAANPEFEMLYYGFKLDDDASIMGTPDFWTEANETSLPGDYEVLPVDGVQPEAGYYQLNGGYPGTLTITALDAPLVVDVPATVVYDEGNLVLDTTDEYGRAIMFSASGACEYNGGGAIDFLYAGTCSIEMTAVGDGTGYTDASASATIEVLPFPVQVVWLYQAPIRLGTETPDEMWNADVSSFFTGTWSYDVPELVVGYNTITATFTPNNGPNYTTGSTTYELLVLSSELTIDTITDITAVAGTPYVLSATFSDCNMQCQFRWFVDGDPVGYDFIALDYVSGDGYFDPTSQFSFVYTEGEHLVRLEAIDVNGDELSAELNITVGPDPDPDPVDPGPVDPTPVDPDPTDPDADADAAARAAAEAARAAAAERAAAEAAADAVARAAADAAAAQAAADAAARAAAEIAARAAAMPDTAMDVPLSAGSTLPLTLLGLLALLGAGVLSARKVRVRA